jgi:hypothetical protein
VLRRAPLTYYIPVFIIKSIITKMVNVRKFELISDKFNVDGMRTEVICSSKV